MLTRARNMVKLPNVKLDKSQLDQVENISRMINVGKPTQEVSKEWRKFIEESRHARMTSILPVSMEDFKDKIDEIIEYLILSKWNDKLNSMGEDTQLENVDLQNRLQKQQQTMQTTSNMSKMLHDTAMAIIKKMN